MDTQLTNPKQGNLPGKSSLWQKISDLCLEWLDLLSFFLMALGIVLCIRFFVFSPFSVVGISMEPTFQSNDFVIIDKVSSQKPKLELWANELSWGVVKTVLNSIAVPLPDLKRWDIVVFVPPGKTIHYIKRIIWLPWETVSINNNQVTICKTNTDDCFVLHESYIPSSFVTETSCGKSEFVVTGGYFVMWDNRQHSTDSRCCFTLWCYGSDSQTGYIAPYDHIIGKVRARIVPNYTRFK